MKSHHRQLFTIDQRTCRPPRIQRYWPSDVILFHLCLLRGIPSWSVERLPSCPMKDDSHCFILTSVSPAFSLAIANTSGHTKKVTVNGILMVGYCVGDIIAPQFFIESEAPGYETGYNALIAGSSVAIAALITYEFVVRIENRRRNARFGAVETLGSDDEDLLDLTDGQKKNFRYVY